jgi:hypothetical protein
MPSQSPPRVLKRRTFRHDLPALLALALSAGAGTSWVAGASAADAPRLFKEAAAEGGELKYINQVPVLFLQGEPEQMGRQQAVLVFSVARRHADLPKMFLGEYSGGLLWPLVVQTSRGLMRGSPERYQRELNAAFAKAGCRQEDKDALIVANGLVELRCFSLCSAFLVEPERSATGELLFGRNFDVPSFGALDRMLLVVVYRPAGRRAFASVTWPGFIGVLSGMNDAGLAVACLDSGPAKDQSPPLSLGTPMALTFRRVLEECTNLDEAEKLLRGSKHTTWMNLAACDRQRAVVFEITPKSVLVRRAEDHLLACTNHFRTPELSVSKNCWRYRTLQRNWDRTQPFTWRDVKSALHAVNLGQETTQSMVFEPNSLRLRLASGKPPASAGRFMPLDLADLFRHQVPSEAR